MSTPITSTTIAKIAGVTVTAVGQWRRRDKTFPQPIDPNTRPVTFVQDEVLVLLTATGRTVDQTSATADQLEITMRQVIDQLRSAVPADQYARILTLFAAQRHVDDAAEVKTAIDKPLASELERMLTDN